MLTINQLSLLQRIEEEFKQPIQINKLSQDPWFTQDVLESIGDTLKMHHCSCYEPLAKERFEYALEQALEDNGIPVYVDTSRTYRGKDITIDGVKVNLKSEYSQSISEDKITIAKWMSVNNDDWTSSALICAFLDHLRDYEKIYILRSFPTDGVSFRYELVEIPKTLMQEITGREIAFGLTSKTNPPYGQCSVRDEKGTKFNFIVNGGNYCFIRLANIRKDLCITHAEWKFEIGNVPKSQV